MGALSATSNEEHVERLGVFGENLGIAFQLTG
jgi:geranylgeranyl pyrophosphate synthase